MTEDLKLASAYKAVAKLAWAMRTEIVSLWRDKQPGEKRGTYAPRRSPLTENDIHNHLAGHQPIGLYVFPSDVGPHGLTRIAVVDLDDKEKKLTWQQLCLQASVISELLVAQGMNPWACRSGSGHGIHLWLTWATPQKAGLIRHILRKAVEDSKTSVHVDIFPSANELRLQENGDLELGSLVALPLARMSRPIISLENGDCVEDMVDTSFALPQDSRTLIDGTALKGIDLESDAGKGNAATEAYGPVDLDTLAEALKFIQTDDYDIWRDVGMALKHGVSNNQLDEASAERLWTEWASKDPKFDARGQDYNWRRFRPNGTLQIATIWYKAKEGGWKPAPESRGVNRKAIIARHEDRGMIWQSPDAPDYVASVNQDHFMALEGGKATIFREEWDPVLSRHKLTRMSPQDFRLIYGNQRVVVGHTKKGVPVVEELGKAWLESEYRRQYNQIALLPEGADETTYNLWRGWTVEPSEEGTCDILKEHLLNNICMGDADAYRYIWKWCAHAMQRPYQPIGTALVMRGGRGTGKSTFARAFGELFGQHFLQVTSSRDLTGRFNSHLRDCIVLFADEAVWAGSKTEESTLKGLITEPYLSIEGKGRDLYQCRNMLHLIIATNSEWSIPAGLDERRYMAIHVGDGKKQDTTYFKRLWHQLNTGGKARLLWELLNEDLSDFDQFNIPQTTELTKQKIMSLDPWSEWWFEKLDAGQVLQTQPWDQAVPLQALFFDYVQHCRIVGQRTPKSVNFLTNKIRSFLPADPVTNRQRVHHELSFGHDKIFSGTLHTMWTLPKLADCRAFFERKSRSTINWTVDANELEVIDEMDTVPF